MALEIKCPVCGQSTTGPFCKHCDFELHRLPDDATPAIKSFEEERVLKFKEKLKEIDDYVAKVKDLSQALDDRHRELESLVEKNKELEETLSNRGPEVELPIAYLVMTKGENVSGIFDIYEGENTFGYALSQGRHQQIICSAQVADCHFSVTAILSSDQRGYKRTKFTVSPKDGAIFASANGANAILREKQMEKNDSIFIDDIRFTLAARKN